MRCPNNFRWLLPLIFALTVYKGDCELIKVTVKKCCGPNEHISKFSNYTYGCLNGKAPISDYLKVYDPIKGSLVNGIPAQWTIIKSRPICDHPKNNTNSPIVFFPNGSLFAYDTTLIHPDRYCYDYKFVQICDDKPHKPVVRKCCGPNAIYSLTKHNCLAMNVTDYYRIDVDEKKYELIPGFPSCEYQMSLLDRYDAKMLTANGTLHIQDNNNEATVLHEGSFCIEHILEKAGGQPSILTCHDHNTTDANALNSKTPSNHNDIRFTLYPIGLAISVVFLIATLAASYLLPASHHVLHWKCQRNHIICLLFGDILLCVTHLSRNMSTTPCIIIAVLMHFLFLSAFFWLNTMCFNIWWTFRDFRPQNLEKSQERFRLRLYEIYAWGFPLLIAGIAAILDMTPDDPTSKVLRPKFAKNSCWFHGDLEILVYFFCPIGILLFINVILFAVTARELTCGLWKRELVKSTSERAALGRVCMKLVVVMGVTWIADVLSWAVGGPAEVWYFTDLINCLQGVFIFIVVGCQPQVLCAVKRLWCFNRNGRVETAGTTNHHSSSSHGLPSLGDSTINHTTITSNSNGKAIPLEPTNC